FYRVALGLAVHAGDRGMQGLAWYVLGVALQALGDLEQALDAYSSSLAIGREAGIPPWRMASRLNSLSIIHRRLGNYAEAIQFAGESLRAAEAVTSEELRDPLAVSQRV